MHDGARPFIKYGYDYITCQMQQRKWCGSSSSPVKDTIKKVEDNKVVETVERSSLWAVQTPQAFRVSILIDAHNTGERR